MKLNRNKNQSCCGSSGSHSSGVCSETSSQGCGSESSTGGNKTTK